MKFPLTAALLIAPLAISGTAFAQEDLDLDGDSSGNKQKRQKASKSVKADLEGEVVREIQRGYYLKSNLGTTSYLLTYSGGILRSGTTLALGFGNDFSDQEDSSMAWEVKFHQGVHNGMHYEQQAAVGVPPPRLIQGDTRTFALVANFEYSRYLTRRLGVGIRGGGGVMMSPLLMNGEAFDDEVVRDSWGGARPAVHDSPHPIVQGGPTFEYYTKLSHFSIGVDIEVSYALGFDLGAGGSGYLKYTF